MPPDPATDTALLRQFVSTGSQAAFGEVVNRNIGLVYRSALGRLQGDRHAAEDVTQQVFMLLSHKARTIPGDAVVAAWLFTTTRHTVSHYLRAQRRRLAREKEAQLMYDLDSTTLSKADWARLKPELDDMISSLGSRERDAILLRFFQGLSLAEVGRQLGISADAARMRIERGTEKLRASWLKRGVGFSAAAIDAALAREATLAVPPGLASSVTAAALSSLAPPVAGSALLNVLMMSKIKTALVIVLVAGTAITAALQERIKAQLRAELAALDQPISAPGRLSSSEPASDQPSPAESAAPRDPDQSPPPRRPRPIVNEAIPGGLVNRGWLPISALRDAGRADVPAAVETMLWGQAHPETTALASTLWVTMMKDPATGKDRWAPIALTPDSAEVVMAARLSKQHPFSEVQVTEQAGSGDNAYITIQFRSTDGRTYQQSRRLHVTGDGWKWIPSAEQLAAANKAP